MSKNNTIIGGGTLFLAIFFGMTLSLIIFANKLPFNDKKDFDEKAQCAIVSELASFLEEKSDTHRTFISEVIYSQKLSTCIGVVTTFSYDNTIPQEFAAYDLLTRKILVEKTSSSDMFNKGMKNLNY